MPVRIDRCPNCWASLPESVGEFCVHCRQSLVPEGRKARREAEEARRAGAGTAPAQPTVPAPAPRPPAPDEPFTGTWRSVPVDSQADLESDLPWGAQHEEAPAPAGDPGEDWAAPGDWAPPGEPGAFAPPVRRSRVKQFAVAGAAVVAAAVAFVAVGLVTGSVGQRVEDTPSVPVNYQGPSFTVRLPGQPKVQETTRGGLTMMSYLYEDRDSATGVTVISLPAGTDFDLDRAAAGVVDGIGGTQIATPVDVAGRPGRDIVVTNAQDGDATAFWRLILDGPTLYQIATVMQGDHVDVPADHRAAVDSFTIR